MKYAQEDFIRLMGEIEEQGGEHVDETCMWDEIEFEMPDGTTKRVKSSGCEKDVLFDVPYDPTTTVLVPEPVLEVDDERSGWTDSSGNEHPTHKTKLIQDPAHPDDPSRQVPLIEYVERESEVLGGADLVLPVRVCAVEDNVGMWPRFAHTMQDPRSR